MDKKDLNNLSKEELLELFKTSQNKTDGGEEHYHSDSLIAMMKASPKEARAITRRMISPATKVAIAIMFGAFFIGILVALNS